MTTTRALPHDPYITAVCDALTAAGLNLTDLCWTDDCETRGTYCYLNAVITLDPDRTTNLDPADVPAGTAWPHGLILVWEWHTGIEADQGEPDRGPQWLFAAMEDNSRNAYPTALPVHGYASPAAVLDAARKVIAGEIGPGDFNGYGAPKWDGGTISGTWETADQLDAACTAWGDAEAADDPAATPPAHDGPDVCSAAETVHAGPPEGSGLTPCCHRSPVELPRTDRMTSNPADVTCHAPLDALLGAVAEHLPPDDPDRSAQTLARMTTPSERAALTNAYAHARRADDAETARADAVHWAAVVEGTLDRVRGVLNTWADYTLEPGQVRRLHDELTHALCDEPVPVVITQDAAAHVLAQEGLDGGYEPGQYVRRLLTAWWSADPDHAARLAAAYPVYGAAIALLRTPGGPAQLHRVATGQDTCRAVLVDGEQIRAFVTGAMSDEDHAALIEGVADMRRRGKATEDACQLIEVDGEQVLVRGDGEMTEQDHAALAQVVEAARRRYAAEHPDKAQED